MNGRSEDQAQYLTSAEIDQAIARARKLRSKAFYDAVRTLTSVFRRSRLKAKKPAVTAGGVYAAY